MVESCTFLCLSLLLQGFARAPLAIQMTLTALWTDDMEGRIRQARDRLVEVNRATELQAEVTRQTASAALVQEQRGDALVARLAVEAEMQAELRARVKFARDRAAQDSAKAEVKEGILAHTKVCHSSTSGWENDSHARVRGCIDNDSVCVQCRAKAT